MKNDDIEIAYEFDENDESFTFYEMKMNDIIEKRKEVLKNLNSNEWNDLSNSCYELFRAYKFIIMALEKNGVVSKAVKYAQEAIEYCEIYRQYVDLRSLNDFSSKYNEILKKYKR